MLRSLPSAIDDALDTLHEPNAIFSQFLGSASMIFFLFSFPCFLFLSCLFVAFLSFLFFPHLFRFSLFFIFFPFLSFIFLSRICFFFPIDLRLSCVCVVIGTACNKYVVVFLGWQAAYFLNVSGGGMNCVSCDILRSMRVPPLLCLCFFPGVFLSSGVTGACPVTTELIMRVHVRTPTTTTTTTTTSTAAEEELTGSPCCGRVI